jgi:hypothetical protein
MLKNRIIACLLTLSAIAATPAAVSQAANVHRNSAKRRRDQQRPMGHMGDARNIAYAALFATVV